MLIKPSLLFPITLAAFAFFPPEYVAPPFDRLLLGVLCLATVWHVLLTRSKLLHVEPVILPLGLLALLALASAAAAPYDATTWSLPAAQYVVPFVMFVIARAVFIDDRSVERFFVAGNILLVYLIFTAIAWLVGAHALVFPRFILDQSLAGHLDRARGPFLQAVTNGTALTMLGLLAWYGWQRRHFRGWHAAFVAVALPIAVIATLTRGVWIAFVCAFALVTLRSRDRAARRVGALGVLVALVALGSLLAVPSTRLAIAERVEEVGPVEFRLALYRSARTMFLERPLLGFGTNTSAIRLRDYIQGYKLETAPVHNTYLEVVLEHGLVGLTLYIASFIMLLRIGRRLPRPAPYSPTFLTSDFVLIWRALVLVFIVNGLFVIMNYQYINALLFSVAGLIRAQEARAAALSTRAAYFMALRS